MFLTDASTAVGDATTLLVCAAAFTPLAAAVVLAMVLARRNLSGHSAPAPHAFTPGGDRTVLRIAASQSSATIPDPSTMRRDNAPALNRPEAAPAPGPEVSTSRRLSARLIDLVLVSVVSYTASTAASVVLLDSVDWDTYRVLAALLGIAVALASIGYFIACDHLVGYTLGKRLLGVKIVQRSGCCPTLRQSFIRNAFLLPMYVGAAAGSVSLLATASTDSLATTVTGLAAGGAISLLGTTTTIGIGVYLLITIHSSPEGRGLHDTKSGTVATARSPIDTTELTPARN